MPRPSKLSGEIQAQVHSLALLGLTDAQMAEVWGVSKSTLNLWKKDNEFLQSLTRGKFAADAKVAEALYQKALAGDVTACIYWLKNRQPATWRDKRELDTTVTGQFTMADVIARSQEGYDD